MKEMNEYNHCKKFMYSGMKEMNEYNHCKTFIYLGMKEMKVNLRPRMKTLLMEQTQTQIPPHHPGTKTPPPHSRSMFICPSVKIISLSRCLYINK